MDDKSKCVPSQAARTCYALAWMLTDKRDLRTGLPVWSKERKPALHHGPLGRDVTTDVLVVGAGISGALVAERLTDLGLGVVVVDRRAPLAGSTSASTALLQHELDVPLIHLTRALGRDRAERIWRRAKLVVRALEERTHQLGIEADVEPRDTLYLAGTELDARGLQREAVARRRLGLEVELLSSRELFARYGVRRSAALLGRGNLVADPRKLAAGYLRAAVARGARVFSPVEVTGIEERARGVVARTSQNLALRARYVVFATGYELVKGVTTAGHSVQSTWAIATRPQRTALWPTECMIWEASDPYLYLRTTPDGRVICGGGDEPFSSAERRDAMSAAKYRFLAKRLKRMFPTLNVEPEFAWTGSFGSSDTGTPIIGRLPARKRSFVILGCGGNGITFSMLGAQVIAGAITGLEDSDASLFAPRRRTST